MNIKSLTPLLAATAIALAVYLITPAMAAPGGTNAPVSGDEKRMREVLATVNDVPIVFYGKLEDEAGNPIAGAEITGRITINNGVKEGADKVNTTSDSDGLFRLDGKGESLSVSPHKEGYAIASSTRLFKYSHLEETPYVPDEKHPAVIKMWKLKGAEPLVGIEQRHSVRLLNGPIYVDLLSKKVVPEGGDIKITVLRPGGVVSPRHPLDWGIQVAAVNGGVVKTSMGETKVTYAAPESGYKPTCSLTSSITNHSWSRVVDGAFFVKSRDGQVYSKVLLSFGINENPDDAVTIEIRGVANANGSRNWETVSAR